MSDTTGEFMQSEDPDVETSTEEGGASSKPEAPEGTAESAGLAEFGGTHETEGTKGQPSESGPGLVQPPRERSEDSQVRDDESSVQPADPADANQVNMVREAEEKY